MDFKVQVFRFLGKLRSEETWVEVEEYANLNFKVRRPQCSNLTKYQENHNHIDENGQERPRIGKK